MRLPKEKIVFIVDTIPVAAFPGRGFIDIYPLETEEFIKKVLAMDWERMIPGHPGPGDRLGTKKDAQDVLTLMQEASAAIKTDAQAGKCWDAVEKDFKMEKYATLPGYANGLAWLHAATARCGAAAPERTVLVCDGMRRRFGAAVYCLHRSSAGLWRSERTPACRRS